ncbi:hypothetical protein [Ferrimicrobium acidiphilum]|uniref:hypothetical protein n=1 Tax=Ferrimicrobium acidiphilum TaxID=121039 RepID=UPI0023EF6ABD|nr:hypothetical protein [Ferrimicrobium acidiphilum]
MPVKREPKNAIDPMTGQPSGGRFASNGPKPMGDVPSIDAEHWDESTIVGHAMAVASKRLQAVGYASLIECLPSNDGWEVRGSVQVRMRCKRCNDLLDRDKINHMIGGDEHAITCTSCKQVNDVLSRRTVPISRYEEQDVAIEHLTTLLLQDRKTSKTFYEQCVESDLSTLGRNRIFECQDTLDADPSAVLDLPFAFGGISGDEQERLGNVGLPHDGSVCIYIDPMSLTVQLMTAAYSNIDHEDPVIWRDVLPLPALFELTKNLDKALEKDDSMSDRDKTLLKERLTLAARWAVLQEKEDQESGLFV